MRGGSARKGDAKKRQYGKRQCDNQLSNKKRKRGEAPVDKRRWAIIMQRFRVDRGRRCIKRTRGGEVNATTSRRMRGNQEGRSQQTRGSGASTAGSMSRGQEAAVRQEASRQPAGKLEANGRGGTSRQEATVS